MNSVKTVMHPTMQKWHKLHKKYLYCNQKYFDFRTSVLAKYLGVSRRTIERWVKRQGSPKDFQIDAIERFLKDKVRQ